MLFILRTRISFINYIFRNEKSTGKLKENPNIHIAKKIIDGKLRDLDIQFKSLLYDFYSKDVSDKVKTSMTIQKKQGKYLVWSPPYGYMKYQNDKYSIIVDEVVASVEKIFSLYLDGLFTRKIARIMKEESYVVPSIRKKQLSNMDYSYNILEYKGKKSSWTNGTITDILMHRYLCI